MTKRLVLILCLELLVCVTLTTGVCLRRPQYVHALHAFYYSPSPQTQAEYQRQRHLSTIYVFVANTIVFGAVLLTTLLIVRRKSLASGEGKTNAVG